MPEPVVFLPTTATHIADYVRRQGACEPGDPILIDGDPMCPVWRVPIVGLAKSWTVPPPRFWYVCPEPTMNLYREDSQRPTPWLPAEEQDEGVVVDYIKSFHLGLMARLRGVEAPAPTC